MPLAASGCDRFTLTGSAVNTDRGLADLAFTAAAVEHSAIVPLRLSGLTGRSGTVVYPETLALDGFVIVLAREPVLLAFGGNPPTLTVFGRPGVTYEVEASDTLAPANWQPFGSVTLITTFQALPLNATESKRYFRARELEARLRFASPHVVNGFFEAWLQNLPGTGELRIETSPDGLTWTPIQSHAITSSEQLISVTHEPGSVVRMFRANVR